jgi:hypothetical protein
MMGVEGGSDKAVKSASPATKRMIPKLSNDLTNPLSGGDIAPVALRGHSYDDHRTIVPALLDTMAACGCWVLDQKALSPTQTELSFEVQLRSVFELYSGLVGAGVELTRDSHIRLTGLCTLRDHNPRQAKRRRVVTICLELCFLEENPNAAGRMVVGWA